MVHHDAELACLSLIYFFETNDIWMVKHFEDLGFPESCLLIIFAHFLDIDLLDDGVGPIRSALHEKGLTEATFA